MDDAITNQSALEPQSVEPTVDVPPNQSGWIERFASVIVEPVATMQQIALENRERFSGMGGAAIAVCVVFALDGLRMPGADSAMMAWLTVPASIATGLALWLCESLLLAVLGNCFGATNEKLRAATVGLGWSFAPWAFMAPLFCYKAALGSAFMLISALPLAWIFILQVVAVSTAFRMKAWQTICLFFIAPALYSTIQLIQFAQTIYVSIASLK